MVLLFRIFTRDVLLESIQWAFLWGGVKLILDFCGVRGEFYYDYHWSLRLFSLDKWFVYVVTIFYLITPLLHRIKSGASLLTLSLCMFVIHYFLPFDGNRFAFVKWMPFVVGNLPIYLLGFWIYSHKVDFNWWKCIFGMVCFVSWCVIKYTNMTGMTHIPCIGILMLPFSLSLCWLSPYIDLAVAKMHIKGLLLFIGKCSLEVYLWHEFFFTYFDTLDLSTALKILWSLFFSTIAVIVTNRICSYIKDIFLKHK